MENIKKEPKYIDIHCHINFKLFDEDRDAVIKRALENDTWLINVGTQIDTSRKAVALANEYESGVYAVVGLHPIHTSASHHDKQELGEENIEFTGRGEIFDKEVYRELLKDPKVVGIGECGLDYYRMEPDGIQRQKDAFIAQIELSNETGKPLMLHIRDSFSDILELLKKYSKAKEFPGGKAGVVHFFTGTKEQAQEFIDLGFMLSFNGVITFARNYDEAIKITPLDMILNDSDSPYVAPSPYRGKRNEPSYIREVTKKIAEVKGLPEEEVAKAIITNAKHLFGF